MTQAPGEEASVLTGDCGAPLAACSIRTHINDSNLHVSNFHLKGDMAQVIIHRPGFFPEFFMNRGWTLTTRSRLDLAFNAI